MRTPPPQCRQRPILPDDAIVEILSWLPVKTLLRFRCVCRSWKSTISDPNFVKLHLQRSPKDANVILILERWNVVENWDVLDFCAVPCPLRSLLSFPQPTISEDVCYVLGEQHWVVGSCNGLVCVAAPSFSLENGRYWFRFWNPATRMASEYSPSLDVELDSPSYFGFGYDDSSDTYKVVAVTGNMGALEDSQKTQVKVHTMGDTFWRGIGSFPALPAGDEGGVYMSGSGTLNWLGLRNFSLGYYNWDDVTPDKLVIVSFDVGKEAHKQFLLPDGLDEVLNNQPVLGVLMGCLCLSLDYRGTQFVLWQMKEYGVEKSWTQLVNVSYQHLQVHSFPGELSSIR